MEIRRTGGESRRGPAEWFTGDVWLDEIAAPTAPSRLAALSVHFSPGPGLPGTVIRSAR